MPEKTPIEDLVKDALKHYEEASSAVDHWSSVIPDALNFYKNYYEKLSQVNHSLEGFLKGQTVELRNKPERPSPNHPTQPFKIDEVTFTGGDILAKGEDTIWFHITNLKLITK